MSARRSSRLQEKHGEVKQTLEDHESISMNAQEAEAKPVRKAKKPKKSGGVVTANRAQDSHNADPEVFRRTRGRRGLSEKLAKEAPLDILLEVRGHNYNAQTGLKPPFSPRYSSISNLWTYYDYQGPAKIFADSS